MTIADKLPPFSNPEQAQKDIQALGACGALLSTGYFCIRTDDHNHDKKDECEHMILVAGLCLECNDRVLPALPVTYKE